MYKEKLHIGQNMLKSHRYNRRFFCEVLYIAQYYTLNSIMQYNIPEYDIPQIDKISKPKTNHYNKPNKIIAKT